MLIGEPKGHLGQTLWLRELHGREDGPPPPVDLEAERRNGAFVRQQIATGALTAVHDIADGGLAVTVAEMALAGGIGAMIAVPTTNGKCRAFFAEDQGLYVATVADAQLMDFLTAADRAGVEVARIGRTIVGRLIFECTDNDHALTLDELRAAHEGFFPKLMGPPASA
jgi:phosphoribosylformylglycinamidine synthase